MRSGWLYALVLTACAALSACLDPPGALGKISRSVESRWNSVSFAPGVAHPVIAAYRGWFGCPGDAPGNQVWLHWFNGQPSAGNLAVDMLPVVDALPQQARCATGLTRYDGQPLELFSSQSPQVIDYHFRLMAQQHVAAVALQRYVAQLQDGTDTARLDQVLSHVLVSAQAYNLPFFVSYDVSNASAAGVVAAIRADLARLQSRLNLFADPWYLHDQGRPVLELWGFGFIDRPGQPAEVASLLADLKAGATGLPPMCVIGGVPAHWRTLDGDARADPAWSSVYLSYDVVSPWSVGAFQDAASVRSYYAAQLAPDLAVAHAAGVRYLPVVFAGLSRSHESRMPDAAAARLNEIPRGCGSLFLAQEQALSQYGLSVSYVTASDGFGDGTAMLPAAVNLGDFPDGAQGDYLDIDRCGLTADWYTRLLGDVAQGTFALPGGF